MHSGVCTRFSLPFAQHRSLNQSRQGAALRTGFAAATRDIILIQDADLEYNPDDYRLLVEPLLSDKAFRASFVKSVQIEEDGFGIEPEIIAKLARKGCRMYEMGISYSGRTYEEGKKIQLEGWRADNLRHF